jgi:hypothetical protein
LLTGCGLKLQRNSADADWHHVEQPSKTLPASNSQRHRADALEEGIEQRVAGGEEIERFFGGSPANSVWLQGLQGSATEDLIKQQQREALMRELTKTTKITKIKGGPPTAEAAQISEAEAAAEGRARGTEEEEEESDQRLWEAMPLGGRASASALQLRNQVLGLRSESACVHTLRSDIARGHTLRSPASSRYSFLMRSCSRYHKTEGIPRNQDEIVVNVL